MNQTREEKLEVLLASTQRRVEELEQALWFARGATIARQSDLEKVIFQRSTDALMPAVGDVQEPEDRQHRRCLVSYRDTAAKRVFASSVQLDIPVSIPPEAIVSFIQHAIRPARDAGPSDNYPGARPESIEVQNIVNLDDLVRNKQE